MRKLYELGKNPLEGFDDLEDYMWAIGNGAWMDLKTGQFKCPSVKILFENDEHGIAIDLIDGRVDWESEISDLTEYVKKIKKIKGTPLCITLAMLDRVDDNRYIRCYMFSNQLQQGLEIEHNISKKERTMKDIEYYEDTDIIFDELLEALDIE